MSIDAALFSGPKAYFFKGGRYVRVTRGETGPGTVDPGYPASIANGWGWPDDFGRDGIDAALHSGSKTYIFSGDRYVRVTRGDTGAGTVDPGYPADISAWGWPDDFGRDGIDAALHSGGKTYFFSGDRYVRVTRGDTGPGTVDAGYPGNISAWRWPDGFGRDGIDAALHSGGKTYFFSGDRYVRVTRGDTGPGTVDRGYPAHISAWRWPAAFDAPVEGIDSALHSGSKTYIFFGGRYLRLTRGDTGAGTVDPGYPANIADGWGWPDGFGRDGIDAALHSGSKTYFFSGDRYVRVTRGDTGAGTVDPGYPGHISAWGWPDGFGRDGIDAALHSGSKTYFFSGGRYVRVSRGDTGAGTVDAGYPRSIASGWGWHRQPADLVSFSVSECVYGWTARYLQAGTHVTVRIRLNPDAGISAATMDTLRTTWRNGIIGKWSDRFDCRAPDASRQAITFDVDWVTSDPHHTVRVRPGPERSNMTTWDTSDTGDVASHEFGHMLGHPDEYADSACPDRDPVGTDTVMDDNTETVARHYNRIAQFHGNSHSPLAAPAEPPEAGQDPPEAPPESAMPSTMMDDLPPEERTETLDRLRQRASSPEPLEGTDDAGVAFEVSGGAPGERYSYRVAVRADGTAEQRLIDQLRVAEQKEESGRVDPDLVRRAFSAAGEVGLLNEMPPDVPGQALQLVPDSMVAILTVHEGTAVRRVVLPADEHGTDHPSFPGEPGSVPLETSIQVPAAAAARLGPVLDALHGIEETLRDLQ